MYQSLPKTGVGITWHLPQHDLIVENLKQVDCVELISEQFTSQEKVDLVVELSKQLPVVTHGVSLSIGTVGPLHVERLDKTLALTNALQSPWFSDHLCYTQIAGIDLGQLTPVPFTEEQVQVVVDHVREMKRRTNRPFLIENITYYFVPPGSSLKEHDFITRVLEQADIGLLLDITNLYTNSVNHGYDPYEFLKNLPSERIVELHIAGGEQHGDLLVDTHSQPVPREVWDLVDFACKLAPVKSIILERDKNQPPFEDLLGELSIAREIFRRHG